MMNQKSIYELLIINTEESNSKLIERYREYISSYSYEDKGNDEECDQDLVFLINSGLEKNDVEEYVSKYPINTIFYAVSLLNEIDIDLIENVINILKTTNEFPVIYFLLVTISKFKQYDRDSELIKVVDVFLNSILFFEMAFYVYQRFDDYKKIHHQIKYHFTRKEDFHKVNFYLDYPEENDQSFFYRVVKKGEIFDKSYFYEKEMSYEKTRELVDLINKHNNPLYTYDEVSSLINDFDNFFENERDVQGSVNTFCDFLYNHNGDFPYIVNFIFTLFTRCNGMRTFAFALSLLRYLEYNPKNKKLYECIERIGESKFFIPFCTFAIKDCPISQKILYNLAKIHSELELVDILECLNFDKKKNFDLLKNKCKDQAFMASIMSPLSKTTDFTCYLNKDKISKTDLEFIYKCVVLSLSTMQFNSSNKFFNTVKILYEKYYGRKEIDFIFLNCLILNYVEEYSKANEMVKLLDSEIKFLRDIVEPHLSYVDAQTYIDEQLYKKDVDPDKVSNVIECMNYFPVERLKELIVLDFKKYIRFLFVLANREMVDDVNECLMLIDNKLENTPVNNKLYTIEENELLTKEDILDSFVLKILNDLALDNGALFPNIFIHGLFAKTPNIRIEFYSNLKNYYQEYEVDENDIQKILNKIIENYGLEEEEKALKLMDEFVMMIQGEDSYD